MRVGSDGLHQRDIICDEATELHTSISQRGQGLGHHATTSIQQAATGKSFRHLRDTPGRRSWTSRRDLPGEAFGLFDAGPEGSACLLYTSDAADE